MSRNISQVYSDNPSTTAADDDLFYKGNTPYGPTDDSAIKFSDLQTSLFSENQNNSYMSFGLGSGSELMLTDASFTAGSYHLTNPCPNIIILDCTTTSGLNLYLPTAQPPDAFGLYQGPIIMNIGTKDVNVLTFGTSPLFTSQATSKVFVALQDNSSTGIWFPQGEVSDIMGNSGSIEFIAGTNMTITNNNNGSITFDSAGSSGATTQVAGAYVVNRNLTNTVFTGSQSLPPNVDVGSFSAIYQNDVQVTTTTISSQTTPIFKNLASGGTRWVNVEFDFSAASTGTPQSMLATITIQENGGPIVPTSYQQSFFIGTTTSPTTCTISGLVPLNTNDYVYLVFESAGTITVGFNYINCSGVDTTVANIPSPVTYSGSITSGDMPQFSGTAGVVVDSGINLFGNSVLTGTNAAIKFPTVLADGNYLQLPHGNNIGEYGGSVSSFFMGYNVAYDATAATYKYVTSGPSALAFELAPTGFFLKYASSVTGGATASFTTGLFMGVTGIVEINSLTASEAVVTDAGKNLISLAYTSSNTASTIVSRDSSGNFSAGTITASLSGNATTSTTATNATNVATTATSTNASFIIPLVPLSTTSNQALSVGSGILFNPSTNILSTTGLNLSGLSASMGVATDSSNNLVSVASSLGINAKAFITTSTQSLSLQTRYFVSYSGGQMVGTLPLATGSGKTIEIIGLASASTSGWKINANVADTIQFGSSLGAAGGSATSTAGSATDAITFIDTQTNIWVVYPALGANIVIA